MRLLRIRVLGALVCVGTALVFAVPPAQAQEAIFLVRHAERLDDSADSPLSADGRLRAERLAGLLRDARIGSIFVTEFQRTRDTAKPLADRLGIPLTPIPAVNPVGLVTQVRALGPRARVLIIGHSDTLPLVLDLLRVATVRKIVRDEYDNLFVVLPSGNREPVFVRLRY